MANYTKGPPLADRFWAKVAKGDGCWLWTGARHSRGYGVLNLGHGLRVEYAHRLAWMFENGPIPAGLLVCHKCDVRNCVRADHLFIGTAADNTADMVAKGRARGRHSRRAAAT